MEISKSEGGYRKVRHGRDSINSEDFRFPANAEQAWPQGLAPYHKYQMDVFKSKATTSNVT